MDNPDNITSAPAVTAEAVGTVTLPGAEYDSMLLQELKKTNSLLSAVLFVLLACWLVKKARTIVGGMTDDGKTD